MPRENINDLLAFLAVAREKSFTRAAAQLGVSQSALSHTISGLEARLGVRLLNRSTRSVSPTETGEQLRASVGPHLEKIEAELDALGEFRGKPAGSIRINASLHAVESILWPKLESFLKRYPGIKVEITVDYALTDIVAERYDAGVRLGEQVAKDMIAVRIGPDFCMTVVATPGYFTNRAIPETPQELTAHNCINLRLPTHGNLFSWEFERGDHEVKVRVDGQLTFNSSDQILRAALAGFGIAYLPENMTRRHVERGELQQVLADWCPPFTGYHLYYPGRRQSSTAFSLLVEALRYTQ
ncbi:MAG TPA: LysR family transcriptional regulator [Steroidobacteraceae bacterium]|nr:LysR family transcriptional regulator [Steroidobacteraceae bacterium]